MCLFLLGQHGLLLGRDLGVDLGSLGGLVAVHGSLGIALEPAHSVPLANGATYRQGRVLLGHGSLRVVLGTLVPLLLGG